ncbi:prolipoprotein diacylglyceryl transferase [Mycobacterium sp. ML4]
MTTTYLAYIPSPPRGVWHLGPLPIRAYAFFIITGILVALVIGDRRWAARGGQRGVVYDIALWTVPFGLIGGRLYHLATDWQTYWGPGGAGLAAAVRIWDGGLGIWGAVALGAVGAWIGCRRRGIPVSAFLDAVAPGVVLAQAIGRLGNYFNQELYGRETTLPWGLEIFYRRDPAGYVDVHSLDGVSTGQVALVVQPTFLYELIWNVLVFVTLIYLDRRFTLSHGRLFASYVALYCIGRFGVELLRDDTATHIAGIRINTFTSTFVFIGAVVYIILAPKDRADPELLRGRGAPDLERVPEPEADQDKELATVAAASAASAAAASAAGGGDEAGAVGEPETERSAAEAEVAEVGDGEAESDVVEEPAAEIEQAVAAESVEAGAEAEPVEVGDGEAGSEVVEEPAAEIEQAVAAEPVEVGAEAELGEVGDGEAGSEVVEEPAAVDSAAEVEIDGPAPKPQDADSINAVVEDADPDTGIGDAPDAGESEQPAAIEGEPAKGESGNDGGADEGAAGQLADSPPAEAEAVEPEGDGVKAPTNAAATSGDIGAARPRWRLRLRRQRS